MTSALLESLLERDAPFAPREPEWLARARRAAAEALVRDGLPGPRSEAWKYTSLRALERRRFANGDPDALSRAIDESALAESALAFAESERRIVFVNGAHRRDLSRTRALDGLSASVLSAARDDELDSWRSALSQGYPEAAAAFARLNTALVADGLRLRVEAGARIEPPVHVVFAGVPADRDLAWNARLLVELGDGASLRLVVHHAGDTSAGATLLGNVVAQHAIGRDARLDLVEIQDAPAGTILIRRSELSLAANARASMHTLEAGAQTMRHDLLVDLAGDGAAFRSRGAFVLRGRQHADTHLDVRHDARDTASDIVWRGVADGRARGVFHGAITVAAGADGADANLSNKNLLLSAQAEIDTQPVLEIHADEVKAAHGATVGQLDEKALFYLRSRGLSRDAARRLLVQAFASAVFADAAPASLRERLDALLASRLPTIAED